MAVKIDIISGFIGAGKTTLINKLIKGLPESEKVAVIENEFGEISIDGTILQSAGIEVKNILGGCICCTLFGDFINAMCQLIEQYSPNRIIIEPTGLGKLSDVMHALEGVSKKHDIRINVLATVIDPLQFDFYIEMFGEFYFDQIKETNTIVVSRAQLANEENLLKIKRQLLDINENLRIIIERWDNMEPSKLLRTLQTFADELPFEFSRDDEINCEHELHHHHDYQEKVHITSISIITPKKFSCDEFTKKIKDIEENSEKYGLLLRAKGYFSDFEKQCYLFNYVHQELNLKKENLAHVEQLVFIGQYLNEEEIIKLFKGKGE